MQLSGQMKFFGLCKVITLRLSKMWPPFCRWHFHTNSLVCKTSLKFILKGPINNNPELVQVMAWHQTNKHSFFFYRWSANELILNITHQWSEILLSLPNYHLQWQCGLHVLQRQWNWKCWLIVVHNEQKGHGWNWTPLLQAMSMQIAKQISIFTALSCHGVGHLNCNATRTVGNTSDKERMSWPYQQVKFSKFVM